ncbi:MAG: transcriptional repressor [Gammaproteobacteria bacterium]|nr:transcriptional repressor [Gammaproteobacteria bacterium]MCF6229850.1 transcriptional repressor [Gammaproteobacteria bacterium]
MEMLKSINEICELLVKYNIGPTQQRICIAQVLCSQPRHLSAEQVLEEVNRKRIQVSKATIYNTLNLFVSTGLIREVIVDPSKVFYDSTTTPHFHFYNEESGEISDIKRGDLVLKASPIMPEGMELAGIDIVVRIRDAT